MKILSAAQQLDFHPHKVQRHINPLDLRQTHGVLLGGDNGANVVFTGLVDQIYYFPVEYSDDGRQSVYNIPNARPAAGFLEAIRHSDTGDGANRFPQPLQGQAFTGIDVLEIKRLCEQTEISACGLSWRNRVFNSVCSASRDLVMKIKSARGYWLSVHAEGRAARYSRY